MHGECVCVLSNIVCAFSSIYVLMMLMMMMMRMTIMMKMMTRTVHGVVRARHWCLPRCPGQVEFVNNS